MKTVRGGKRERNGGEKRVIRSPSQPRAYFVASVIVIMIMFIFIGAILDGRRAELTGEN